MMSIMSKTRTTRTLQAVEKDLLNLGLAGFWSSMNVEIEDDKNLEQEEGIEDILFLPAPIDPDENISYSITIPYHMRCASHILNLIASADIINKRNKNASMKSRHTNIIFKDFLEFSDKTYNAVIATATNPILKLKWPESVGELVKEYTVDIKQNIVNEAKALLKIYQSTVLTLKENIKTYTNINFIEFHDKEDNCVTEKDRLIAQVLQILQDPDINLSMLKKYRYVQNVFITFNTPLPSSAPVERLFSYATFVNPPRRHALSDENLENLILLNYIIMRMRVNVLGRFKMKSSHNTRSMRIVKMAQLVDTVCQGNVREICGDNMMGSTRESQKEHHTESIKVNTIDSPKEDLEEISPTKDQEQPIDENHKENPEVKTKENSEKISKEKFVCSNVEIVFNDDKELLNYAEKVVSSLTESEESSEQKGIESLEGEDYLEHDDDPYSPEENRSYLCDYNDPIHRTKNKRKIKTVNILQQKRINFNEVDDESINVTVPRPQILLKYLQFRNRH
ncbi:unnamed protein product [Psylliodes chrysocephalus]|uniref:Uncharacterized protein n=1 Tax=Psylliodes chrysocephalus TaxID=3402493 RepID=A0A9P0D720_9CUCU|nr:unnamed protein product [Psylliodes chrysocephala]